MELVSDIKDLIGHHVRIIAYQGKIGGSGLVVFETVRMLVIRIGGVCKKYAKDVLVLLLNGLLIKGVNIANPYIRKRLTKYD